jgi:deoxyribodipyrimidine photolyase
MSDFPQVPSLVWFRQDLRLSDNPVLSLPAMGI